MSILKKSSADHVDMHRRLLFLTMLLLSLVFAIKSSLYLVDGALKSVLVFVAKSLAILSVLMLALTVFWKLRFIPQNERFRLLTSIDSFVMLVINKACRTSWVLTFVLMNLVMMTTSRDTSRFLAEFYLNLMAFFMLASFSLGFFILFHSGKTETE